MTTSETETTTTTEVLGVPSWWSGATTIRVYVGGGSTVVAKEDVDFLSNGIAIPGWLYVGQAVALAQET